jgi:protein-tyrosine-phosphatase
MNILFVCQGNTCRSPMAAALLNEVALRRAVRLNALSAGLEVFDRAASPKAVQVMKERNIDISFHQPQTVSDEHVQWADLILTMGDSHLGKLRREYPAARGKSDALARYVGDPDGDVQDPYGASQEDYRATRDRLEGLVVRVLDKVEHSTSIVDAG